MTDYSQCRCNLQKKYFTKSFGLEGTSQNDQSFSELTSQNTQQKHLHSHNSRRSLMVTRPAQTCTGRSFHRS